MKANFQEIFQVSWERGLPSPKLTPLEELNRISLTSSYNLLGQGHKVSGDTTTASITIANIYT